MPQQLLRRSILVGLALLLALVATSAAPATSTPVQGNNEFVLKPPPFVGVAQAQESPDAFPQDEAGISAYFRAPFPVTIASVRPAFRTIEYEDFNYIIGSVAVPDYPESEDVHVYVHRDGWFLAYYLAADPAGKIVDWRLYHNTGRNNLSTKLESALSVVALPVGVTPSGISFYDFRYPNASRLIFIADWTVDSADTFQINLPNDFGYFERSWSLGTNCGASLSLDGQVVGTSGGSGGCQWTSNQGILTALQLSPGVVHTVGILAGGCCGIYRYGGLVLIYRVP